MGQVDGNLVQNAWSCYASYSQSTDNTSSTISITAGMRSHGYGMSLSGFWVGIDQGGYSRSSTDTSFYSSTGGWVDKDLLNYTDTWTRTHEDRTINCWAAIDRSDAGYRPGKSTAWMTFIVPAKDHWTIAYNANGGSGAPGSQTKWRDENLTLSSTKPTRTGYSFQGWATSSGGSVAYQPGASYTSNSGTTLYAVWKADTYTVKFNSNGGSGAPGNQTKTYGINLTLSSTKPTRHLYNFLGWATSSNGGVAYQPGGTYTANAAITLYAVWELAWVAPTFNDSKCYRCNSSGVADDLGTYVKLSGNWTTDRDVESIVVTVNGVNTPLSGTSKAGTISVTLGDGKLSAEQAYTVKLVITDEIGPGTWTWTISATHYILDFAPNGSVGVNTVADGGTLGMTVDMPINGSIFYGGFIPEIGTAPSYVKLGTWSLASGNVYNFIKSVLNFELNFNNKIMQGQVQRPDQSTVDATSNAFYITLSHNFGNDSLWPSLLGRVISKTDIELWIKNTTATWRRGEYTVHGASGKWIPSSELTTIEPKGTFCSTIFTPREFSVGSGLALSNRGVLSIGTNYRNVSIPTENQYIKIYLSRIGPLVMFKFSAYREDRVDWLGNTSGSIWGWKIATIPDWAIPDAPSGEDSVTFHHPVYSRFWDGNALFSISIYKNKDVKVSWNCASGFPNSVDFTDIYLAK